MGTRVPETLAEYVRSHHLGDMFSESVPKRAAALDDHYNAGFLDAYRILGAGIDLARSTRNLRRDSMVCQKQRGAFLLHIMRYNYRIGSLQMFFLKVYEHIVSYNKQYK